jgi:hypothetical protein
MKDKLCTIVAFVCVLQLSGCAIVEGVKHDWRTEALAEKTKKAAPPQAQGTTASTNNAINPTPPSQPPSSAGSNNAAGTAAGTMIAPITH